MFMHRFQHHHNKNALRGPYYVSSYCVGTYGHHLYFPQDSNDQQIIINGQRYYYCHIPLYR